ncbi:MAG: hypothetical protein LBO80_08540 [Treponema sp.]|jgi:hypothetical protein|nr:hypothetical protein [Treponema sp.]
MREYFVKGMNVTINESALRHKEYYHNMMVILDQLSAQYLTAKMLATKQSPTEIISNMVRRELSLAEVAHQ